MHTWASLVDAPSSHPEKFPTEETQNKERERLFDILRRLVKWESTNDEKVLAEAREEILKSMGDDLPEFLDPFAGGGAIPLEAQRLGLKVHAHDLNPVAVMINKAMIEIRLSFPDFPLSILSLRQKSSKPIPIGEMKFGAADTLARAKNTSVDALSNCGAATAAKGIVKLNTLDELPEFKSTEQSGVIWNLTHYLVRAVQNDGFMGAANLINSLSSMSDVEHAKELAYRLYSLCDRMKLTQLAVQYNMLVTSWTDIMKRVGEKKKDGMQGSLEF